MLSSLFRTAIKHQAENHPSFCVSFLVFMPLLRMRATPTCSTHRLQTYIQKHAADINNIRQRQSILPHVYKYYACVRTIRMFVPLCIHSILFVSGCLFIAHKSRSYFQDFPLSKEKRIEPASQRERKE